MISEYVSLPEYAKLHDLEESTVRKKILAGNFPAMRIGNRWAIRKDEPWIDLRKKENKTEDNKMKYRVEHKLWNGSGWSYNETIDNINEILTADELKEAYGDYCTNDGDMIELLDNDSDEAISEYRRLDD